MNRQNTPLTDIERTIFEAYFKKTYRYFLFNRIGRYGFDNKSLGKFPGISGEIYYENMNLQDIWNTMLQVAEFSYLSHLANIFDKDSHYDKTLGRKVGNIVFCRITDENKLIGCGDTIDKIKTARNKMLDHIDSDIHTHNINKYLSEIIGLDKEGKDVQVLFNETFKVLKMENDQKAIEEEMKEKFKEWYDIFKKGYFFTTADHGE